MRRFPSALATTLPAKFVAFLLVGRPSGLPAAVVISMLVTSGSFALNLMRALIMALWHHGGCWSQQLQGCSGQRSAAAVRRSA